MGPMPDRTREPYPEKLHKSLDAAEPGRTGLDVIAVRLVYLARGQRHGRQQRQRVIENPAFGQGDGQH